MAAPASTVSQEPQTYVGPYRFGAVVTPSDSTDLTRATRAIYVGGTGNLTVNMDGDNGAVLISAIPAGVVLPISARRVLATGTTATLIVALW